MAWVVGFLEGEGCFQFGGSAYVVASQKQLWPLERLKELLGGKIYYKAANGISQWHLTGPAAERLMKDIQPHMSPRRQEQIGKVFAKRSLIARHGSPEHRKRISEGLRRHHKENPEHRKKISERFRQYTDRPRDERGRYISAKELL